MWWGNEVRVRMIREWSFVEPLENENTNQQGSICRSRVASNLCRGKEVWREEGKDGIGRNRENHRRRLEGQSVSFEDFSLSDEP
jgi:hypothetical protein